MESEPNLLNLSIDLTYLQGFVEGLQIRVDDLQRDLREKEETIEVLSQQTATMSVIYMEQAAVIQAIIETVIGDEETQERFQINLGTARNNMVEVMQDATLSRSD